ncbi:hypothetical protein RB653_004993 [Dictyostelium firmibasis]|uniref:Uncharacterized protein n=1 Tax=Dictyostelium firmibasis TaxID=79012 RepID=A0AAN7Z3S1_9MYCE
MTSMEKYATNDIQVENITLKNNTQTEISEGLSFDIDIKKLNQDILKGLYCRVEFVVDIAFNNFTFDILKSSPIDYYPINSNISLNFKDVQSLEELMNKNNIDKLFWCNISCLHIYINYKKDGDDENVTENSLKISIPTNIYKDKRTDNIIYKTTYNPFDYL